MGQGDEGEIVEAEGWGVGNEKVGGMRLADIWLEFGCSLAEKLAGRQKEGRRRVSIDVDVGVGVGGYEGVHTVEGVLRLLSSLRTFTVYLWFFETLLILDGSCSHDRKT